MHELAHPASPRPPLTITTAVLALYGYTPQRNHRGQCFFSGETTWHGERVRCCLGLPGLRALPEALHGPVWVGYYALDAEGAMLSDEITPSLLGFLRRLVRPAAPAPQSAPPSARLSRSTPVQRGATRPGRVPLRLGNRPR
mgnify:CR=1 FL=1